MKNKKFDMSRFASYFRGQLAKHEEEAAKLGRVAAEDWLRGEPDVCEVLSYSVFAEVGEDISDLPDDCESCMWSEIREAGLAEHEVVMAAYRAAWAARVAEIVNETDEVGQ